MYIFIHIIDSSIKFYDIHIYIYIYTYVCIYI